MAFVNAIFFVRTLYMLARTPRLRPKREDTRSGENPDKVSVLVPARNEASRVLRENLLSLARQSYSQLEVIVVDDRSIDFHPFYHKRSAIGVSDSDLCRRRTVPAAGMAGEDICS